MAERSCSIWMREFSNWPDHYFFYEKHSTSQPHLWFWPQLIFFGGFSNFCRYYTRSQTGKSTGYRPTLKPLLKQNIKYQSNLICFTCVSMLHPFVHKHFHHLIYNSFNILIVCNIFSFYLLGLENHRYVGKICMNNCSKCLILGENMVLMIFLYFPNCMSYFAFQWG